MERVEVRQTRPTQSLSRILPALIHIQTHLDQDLSLDLLADESGLSKFHFHQLFRRATGETPKAYVDRLRLEWAALHLRIRRAPVMEIALQCGYQNHETFSRAFRARFGLSPRDYRQTGQWRETDNRSPPFRTALGTSPRAQLSMTRVVRLSRMVVAFIRQTGPYERVELKHFDRLTTWARRRGVVGDPPLLLGIVRDAPGITPAAKLRFDCCVQIPAMLDSDGTIGCQRISGGYHAVTDYVGSWDLKPAYTAIFERLRQNPTVEIIGLPAIEIYGATRIGLRRGLAKVSIAIPVKPRA